MALEKGSVARRGEYLAALAGPVDIADTPAAQDTRIRNTLTLD